MNDDTRYNDVDKKNIGQFGNYVTSGVNTVDNANNTASHHNNIDNNISSFNGDYGSKKTVRSFDMFNNGSSGYVSSVLMNGTSSQIDQSTFSNLNNVRTMNYNSGKVQYNKSSNNTINNIASGGTNNVVNSLSSTMNITGNCRYSDSQTHDSQVMGVSVTNNGGIMRSGMMDCTVDNKSVKYSNYTPEQARVLGNMAAGSSNIVNSMNCGVNVANTTSSGVVVNGYNGNILLNGTGSPDTISYSSGSRYPVNNNSLNITGDPSLSGYPKVMINQFLPQYSQQSACLDGTNVTSTFPKAQSMPYPLPQSNTSFPMYKAMGMPKAPIGRMLMMYKQPAMRFDVPNSKFSSYISPYDQMQKKLRGGMTELPLITLKEISSIVYQNIGSLSASSSTINSILSPYFIYDESKKLVLNFSLNNQYNEKKAFAIYNADTGLLIRTGDNVFELKQGVSWIYRKLTSSFSLPNASMQLVFLRSALIAYVPENYELNVSLLYLTLRHYFSHWSFLMEPTSFPYLCFTRSDTVDQASSVDKVITLPMSEVFKLSLLRRAIYDIKISEAIENKIFYYHYMSTMTPLSTPISQFPNLISINTFASRSTKYLVTSKYVIIHDLCSEQKLLNAYTLIMPLLCSFMSRNSGV